MAIIGADGVTYNDYSSYAKSGTTPAGNSTIVASPSTPATALHSYYDQDVPNTGFVTTVTSNTIVPSTPEKAASAGWSLADISSWFRLGSQAVSALVGNIPALIGTIAAPAVQAITPLLPAPTPIGEVITAANTFFNAPASDQRSSTPTSTFNPGDFNYGNFNPVTNIPTTFTSCVTYRTQKGIPQTGQGNITKAMAIAAVTDFYAGAISKSCAITIVVDYFSSDYSGTGSLSSVVITTNCNGSIQVGNNCTIVADGKDSTGARVPIPNIIWSKSNNNVTINTTGLNYMITVTGLTIGVTTITATSGNISKTTNIIIGTGTGAGTGTVTPEKSSPLLVTGLLAAVIVAAYVIFKKK